MTGLKCEPVPAAAVTTSAMLLAAATGCFIGAPAWFLLGWWLS